MQKIVPFLWFNNEAEEAAKLYTSLFPDSRITTLRRYGEAGPGPKGSVMTASFVLDGLEVMALNGGPVYSFTPAISFFVACRTEQEIDSVWKALSPGGRVLMELQKYPFSPKYGWLSDRYGLSWQLILAEDRARISPFLTFVGAQNGKAEQAMRDYVSFFPGSALQHIERYPPGRGEPETAVVHGRFSLAGQQFIAMESSGDHRFPFTPAFSFFINCETQAEVDHLWDEISRGGRTDQCGWVSDRYGVSWQVVPAVLGKLLGDPDTVRSNRAMKEMLTMTKLDIGRLQKAFDG